MKKIMTNLMLASMLLSMAAAKSDTKKGTKKGTKTIATATTKNATADKKKSFEGWISDDKCGANVDANCSKACRGKGAKLVFVDTNKQVIPLANQDTVTAFIGQRVTVQGKMENGVLTVDSVKAASN